MYNFYVYYSIKHLLFTNINQLIHCIKYLKLKWWYSNYYNKHSIIHQL